MEHEKNFGNIASYCCHHKRRYSVITFCMFSAAKALFTISDDFFVANNILKNEF